ncbi:hypothetical protein LMH87_010736 [Akanthomyces muscarius]|uniref:Uncharacterized protein n=1 Tax=Akanthomyces muscarius TaxID=2231603 RepID=A0A9W8Q8M0_AKAMU|nr:hypothetical protein LMH87_010736 [Akanthomyces muscarius]KAJ4149964.1 hypothetical protein LMH87_010736 [Akanthomyces muscarius]
MKLKGKKKISVRSDGAEMKYPNCKQECAVSRMQYYGANDNLRLAREDLSTSIRVDTREIDRPQKIGNFLSLTRTRQ